MKEIINMKKEQSIINQSLSVYSQSTNNYKPARSQALKLRDFCLFFQLQRRELKKCLWITYLVVYLILKGGLTGKTISNWCLKWYYHLWKFPLLHILFFLYFFNLYTFLLFCLRLTFIVKIVQQKYMNKFILFQNVLLQIRYRKAL